MENEHNADYVRDEGGFSIHGRYDDGDGGPEFRPGYWAYIYLGVTIVFEYSAPATSFPAGIEDFAGIAFRRFSERLRSVLQIDGYNQQ